MSRTAEMREPSRHPALFAGVAARLAVAIAVATWRRWRAILPAIDRQTTDRLSRRIPSSRFETVDAQP